MTGWDVNERAKSAVTVELRIVGSVKVGELSPSTIMV